jgi:hypothetical protein
LEHGEVAGEWDGFGDVGNVEIASTDFVCDLLEGVLDDWEHLDIIASEVHVEASCFVGHAVKWKLFYEIHCNKY